VLLSWFSRISLKVHCGNPEITIKTANKGRDQKGLFTWKKIKCPQIKPSIAWMSICLMLRFKRRQKDATRIVREVYHQRPPRPTISSVSLA